MESSRSPPLYCGLPRGSVLAQAPDLFQSLDSEESRLQSEVDRDPACQRLFAQLAQVPSYKKLLAVQTSKRALRAAYGQEMSDAPEIKKSEHVQRGNGSTSPKNPRVDSISYKVRVAAQKFFQTTGTRAGSGAVLRYVTEQGIAITNKKPQNQVASILSHDELFDNRGDERGVGYGLREWTVEREELHATPSIIPGNIFGDPLFGEPPSAKDAGSTK